MTKENIINFEGKNLSELKELLKSLKLYIDLSKKLGNRGKKLFKSLSTGTSIYRIEYFEKIKEEDALEQGLIAYKKIFGITPKKEDIIMLARESLEGGIRIYKDDNLSDLSFKKAREALK